MSTAHPNLSSLTDHDSFFHPVIIEDWLDTPGLGPVMAPHKITSGAPKRILYGNGVYIALETDVPEVRCPRRRWMRQRLNYQ
jgi:hypothetical protein